MFFCASMADVVLVRIDAERLAQRWQQMILIELGVPLDRLVIQLAGELPEFGHGFSS
jgi:hypothetical protein